MNELRRIAWICTAAVLLLTMAVPLYALDFDFNWRFSKGNFATAMMPGFDDSDWRTVNVPHDWSIEGPFSADYGSGNGFAPGGIGWYRKHFKLDAADQGKRVVVEFDGVYHNSEVWINGQFVGRRPYGYSSFHYDLTRHVRFGDGENVIAVRVDHTTFADSRWYTGSGIYRHVRLCTTDQLHIAPWGIYVTTPEVNEDSAVIRAETVVRNDHNQSVAFSLESSVIAPDGEVAATLTVSGTLDCAGDANAYSSDQDSWPTVVVDRIARSVHAPHRSEGGR